MGRGARSASNSNRDRYIFLSPSIEYPVSLPAPSLLLGARVNPKVVSEMLGHVSVSITLDIYAHVLLDMQQDAATTMQRLVFQPK